MRKDRSFSVILNAFLAIFCLLAASGTAKAALSDGLVLQLHFNEGSGTTAYDSSGYGNNGTLESGVTWTTGISGSALYFNGTGSVPVPTATDLSLINNSFTISTWFKSTPIMDGNPIFGQSATSDYAPVITMSGHVNADGGRVLAATSTAGAWVYTPTITWDDGNWHNLVFTAADNGTSRTVMQLYMDGVLKMTTSNGASGIVSWPTMHDIGGNGTGSFTGTLDEFSIYSRVLSQTEVTELYNGGAFAPVPIPAAAWLLGSGLMSLVGARRRFFRV